MLSRAADNLYWLTRYVERAEAMSRILSVAHRMSMQSTHGGTRNDEWEA
ncbi:MAG: alpha-E domain-containing protein, partial [Ferrovibrio sp.]